MRALDTTLLSQACRIFLSLAYPDGESSIPLPRRAFLRRAPEEALENWLAPPLCQPVPGDTGIQGYAWRLGCRHGG